MRCRMSGPSVAALLLAVASALCPATLLDDTTHNVSVEDILAPRGTIDSGLGITPRCVVANYGTSAESLWTFMAVDAGAIVYSDSVWLPALAPAARETVTFAPWVPQGRDSMTALAWTECEGDTLPHDDTATVRFLVRVRGIVIIDIITPARGAVYDSGVVFNPQARVWNCGNVSLNFDLRFRIWRIDSAQVPPDYESWRNLNLIAGGMTIVTAPDPWVARPDTWVCEIVAILPGAPHQEDNAVRDTFYVRGTVLRDVAVTRIETSLPPDSIHVGEPFNVATTVANLGVDAAAFKGFFLIRDSSGTPMYADSANHMLGPGDSATIQYDSIILSVPGNYVAACSVYMADDQNPANDTMRVPLHVLPVGGVEEGLKPQASSYKLQATVVRRLPAGAVVFDATGRRVLNPKPGVCYVKEQSAFGSQQSGPSAAGREPSAVNVRKVILQR